MCLRQALFAYDLSVSISLGCCSLWMYSFYCARILSLERIVYVLLNCMLLANKRLSRGTCAAPTHGAAVPFAAPTVKGDGSRDTSSRRRQCLLLSCLFWQLRLARALAALCTVFAVASKDPAFLDSLTLMYDDTSFHVWRTGLVLI